MILMEHSLLLACLLVSVSSVEGVLSCADTVYGPAEDYNGEEDENAIGLSVCCNENTLVITLNSYHSYLILRVNISFMCYDELKNVVEQGSISYRRVSQQYTVSLKSSAHCSVLLSYVDENFNPEQHINAMCTSPRGPGPVSALRVEPRLTSILLTWSAPQELNGVLVNYEVTYRVNDGDVIAVNITDTAFTIPLLTPSTTVSGISIRAYNNVGRGAVAQYDDVDTLPEPHLPVVNHVGVEQLSSVAARVSWDGIDIPQITGYTVYYSQTDANSGREKSKSVPSMENSLDILGLASNVQYQFQVAAIAEFYEGRVDIGDRSPVDDESRITIRVRTQDPSEYSNLAIGGAVIFLFTFLCTISTVLLMMLCNHRRCSTRKGRGSKNGRESSLQVDDALELKNIAE